MELKPGDLYRSRFSSFKNNGVGAIPQGSVFMIVNVEHLEMPAYRRFKITMLCNERIVDDIFTGKDTFNYYFAKLD